MNNFSIFCDEIHSVLSPNGVWNSRFWKGKAELKEQIMSRDMGDLKTWDERVWGIRNRSLLRPVCAVCDGVVQLHSQILGFRRTCSVQCAARDSATKQKTADTLKEQYGGHHTQNTEWRETAPQYSNAAFSKGQETFTAKYGVKNRFQLETVKTKIRETNLSRYGVENPQKSEKIRAKTASTCQAKFGRSSGFAPQFGEQNPMTQYSNVFAARCSKLKNRDWDTLEKTKHFNYISICGNNHIFTCKLCGEETRAAAINAKCQCYEKSMEKDLANFVSSLGVNVKRRDRKTLNGLELDILCAENKLAIELNGIYWHGENVLSKRVQKPRDYHRTKYELAAAAGIKLLQFTDLEWMQKQSLVKSMIAQRLGFGNKIGARELSVIQVPSARAAEFVSANHINGSINGFHVGLEKAGELFAVATFGKNRFGDGTELLRLCSKQGITVIGGASRMITVGCKILGVKSLISYCDLRFGDGEVYRKLKFKQIHGGTPGYWYIDPAKDVLYSRQKFQKHKLSKLLEIFDPNLSEWENMQMNGYDRIWDAGHSKWELTLSE